MISEEQRTLQQQDHEFKGCLVYLVSSSLALNCTVKETASERKCKRWYGLGRYLSVLRAHTQA